MKNAKYLAPIIRGWPTPGKKTMRNCVQIMYRQTMDSNITEWKTGIRENDNIQNHEKGGGG